MAANLTDAAHLTYVRSRSKWTAATLQAAVLGLINDVSPIFDDNRPDDRPVGNWLVPLKGLEQNFAVGVLPLVQFDQAVDYIYRLCLAGAAQLAEGLITNTQATALLAAWNTRIGP